MKAVLRKQVISLLLVAVFLASMAPQVLADGSSMSVKEVMELFDSRVQHPHASCILVEPETVTVEASRGKLIYALSKPGSGKLFDIEDGSSVIIYARQEGFALGLVEGTSIGGWMNELFLTPRGDWNFAGLSMRELLDHLDSRIKSPKSASVLDVPEAKIVEPKNGKLIYALAKPGDTKLFEIEAGMPVTVYARESGFALAVVNGTTVGGWMNESFLIDDPGAATFESAVPAQPDLNTPPKENISNSGVLSGQKGKPVYTDFVQALGGIAALRADGTVAFYDINGDVSEADKEEIASWSDIVQIMGPGCLLALRKDGKVMIVGSTNAYFDEIADDVRNWKNIASLAHCGIHAFALGKDGKLYVAGQKEIESSELYPDLSKWKNLKKVICGVIPMGEYMLGLKKDGSVLVLPVGEEEWTEKPRNVKDIASNGYLNLALLSNGHIAACGEWLEPETIKEKKNIGSIFNTNYALRKDGSVVILDQFEAESSLRIENVSALYNNDSGVLLALHKDGTVSFFVDGEPSEMEPDVIRSWKNVVRLWISDDDYGKEQMVIVAWMKDGSMAAYGLDLSLLG